MNVLIPLAILGLGLTASAQAMAAPRILPSQDVVVRYDVTASGQAPADYDVSFSAESDRARIDDPARGLWFLVDLDSATAALVVPQMHAIVTEPDLAGLAALLDRARGARFTPLGQETIAGLACTRYLVLANGANGTACLTNDGVALAVDGHNARGSARVRAVSVSETAVPADTLAPPAGYSTVDLPPGTIASLLGG